MNVLNWETAVLQLFLVGWFTLYAHAGNNRASVFWAAFLNPFYGYRRMTK